MQSINKNSFNEKFKGKSISVIGIGISNTPIINMLSKTSATIIARDKKELSLINKETVTLLNSLNVKLICGEDYLKDIKEDYVIKTPAMRFDTKELLNARKNGSIITSEMELFFELCPAKIFGVTGSDGKTTTTTLISKFLEKEGYNCYLGGNIGTPLLPLINQINKEDFVIVELSSFQLHTMKMSPSVAVITNLSPNHLDVHKSYEEYIEAKENIYKYQHSNDTVILNYDNDVTRSFIDKAKSNVLCFSRKTKVSGAYLEGDNIYFNDELIMNKNDIKLKGDHNIENYMAAICAVHQYVSTKTIKFIAQTFGGVSHRLEFVREKDNISFYNSSIDSSPSRTIAALSTFNEKIILIAGGKDKGISYDSIGDYICDKVKILLLIGPTAKAIEKSVLNSSKEKPKIIFCNSYEEIVKTAFSNAISGDNILLSPASTSFDMFTNFEERGNTFKKIVNSL
ncbi:MAG: UDP-N-acetylmuramoyl-L-alanine--D-glutamate ligase [Clostridia bacterium]